MGDLAFHRKYRPKTFAKYRGNDKLKQGLLQAINSPKRPQIILLKGPAGTGKTTMARLLAKEYRCTNRDPEKGACGVCFECQQMNMFIESGICANLMYVREVDATNENKKQDVDELIEDASQPSFDGNWKVFILDECHAISSGSQNRLLKLLEEPPNGVLIVLCTTNPEKMLDTIVTRCQYNYSVQKPSREEMCALMRDTCRQESILCDTKALSLIAVKSDFTPRKALILLEQVYTDLKEVTYENAVKSLNVIEDKYYFGFCNLLTDKPINTQKYIEFVGRLRAAMPIEEFVSNLIPFLLRGIYTSHAVEVEGLDESELAQYKKLFQKFTLQDISYILDTLLTIKSSKDVEGKLLLLGFKGIAPVTASMENQPTLIDTGEYSAKEEKKIGDANYQSASMASEEAVQSIIADALQVTTLEEFCAESGGIFVTDFKQN